MQEFNVRELKKLYIPSAGSHKGQNGKLLIIGGSKLFHAASLWALEIASKIVDMVYYSSVPENNKIVLEAKKAFRNGIVVRREDLEDYVEEADCILIGPGLMRQDQRSNIKDQISKQISGEARSCSAGQNAKIQNIKEINKIEDEGLQTRLLTHYLFIKYPHKKWVIDAGSLQEMEAEWIPKNAILTPHMGEFQKMFNSQFSIFNESSKSQLPITNYELSKRVKFVSAMAKKYHCTILLKGVEDTICSPEKCVVVKGGNAGMTKGGTGDVLAGLTAALYCKNKAFLSACAASFLNKKAGETLFEKQGYYFNASDLASELPRVMKRYMHG